MYKVYNVYIRYMMLLVHSGKIFVLVQQGQELGYRNSKITFKEENMTAEQQLFMRRVLPQGEQGQEWRKFQVVIML